MFNKLNETVEWNPIKYKKIWEQKWENNKQKGRNEKLRRPQSRVTAAEDRNGELQDDFQKTSTKAEDT